MTNPNEVVDFVPVAGLVTLRLWRRDGFNSGYVCERFSLSLSLSLSLSARSLSVPVVLILILTSERLCNNFEGFKDFYLKAQTRIWP